MPRDRDEAHQRSGGDVITLIDLGAMFWREALGGNDPLRGYEASLDKLQRYRHERAVVCADSPRSARKEAFEGYKAQRKPKPKEAVEALEGVIARVTAWGMPVAQCDGWEADDVVCTLTGQAWPRQTRIIGSEKDFFVLMNEWVTLVRDNGSVITANDCVDKFGVAPSQMTDWLAMVGDAADNIPGCPNCGPDRASKLLSLFGTIAEVKAAVSDGRLVHGTLKGIGEKTLASLHEWDPTLALDMVRMRDDLPIDLATILGD